MEKTATVPEKTCTGSAHDLGRSSLALLGTHGIPARYGGFETFAEELAVRLAAKSVPVTVYCKAGDGGGACSHKGVDLIYMPALRLGPLTTLYFDIRCLWHARKRYDIVYMLGYGAALFCFLPRLWGRRVWINPDGIEWARAKWGWLAKFYFRIMESLSVRTADRIIADAEAIRQHLLRRHHVTARCSVIPYGAEIVGQPPDVQKLTGYGLVPTKYYLVVCRLEPENNVAEIIEGYVASKSEFPLVVVGDHKSRTAYVRSLLGNHDDRVRFLGTVYDRDTLQTLRYYCAAYFHGHSVGGTNPSLLEALGCGNIIVAHDNPFNREVAHDCAMYFQNPSVILSYMTMIESLNDQQRQEARLRSQQRIRDHYTWDTIADRYLAILQEDAPRPAAASATGMTYRR